MRAPAARVKNTQSLLLLISPARTRWKLAKKAAPLQARPGCAALKEDAGRGGFVHSDDADLLRVMSHFVPPCRGHHRGSRK